MNKHTPEPWNYNDDMQFSKLHEGAIILKREDAIRAFKCVNACAEISNEELEAQRVLIRLSNLAYQRDKARQERDIAEAERDEHQQAVIQWERLMFELVGEDGPKSVREAVESLKAERDELLAVLEAFPGFTDDATVGDPWIESVRNAIAKVKGGAK